MFYLVHSVVLSLDGFLSAFFFFASSRLVVIKNFQLIVRGISLQYPYSKLYWGQSDRLDILSYLVPFSKSVVSRPLFTHFCTYAKNKKKKLNWTTGAPCSFTVFGSLQKHHSQQIEQYKYLCRQCTAASRLPPSASLPAVSDC